MPRDTPSPLAYILLVLVLVSLAAPAAEATMSHGMAQVQAIGMKLVDDRLSHCDAPACARARVLRQAIDATSCETSIPAIALSASLMAVWHDVPPEQLCSPFQSGRGQ